MSVSLPLKEKAEVWPATWSSLISARELSSSSVSPSEKYSCSLSPLMFTNGSTAIECCGGAKATDLATQGFSTMQYAATAASATATHAGFKREDVREATAGTPLAAVGEELASPDRSCWMRLTNSGGVSPRGRRVHCTR
jgi:hypothetical protein